MKIVKEFSHIILLLAFIFGQAPNNSCETFMFNIIGSKYFLIWNGFTFK